MKIVLFDLMDTLLVDPVHRAFQDLFRDMHSLKLYRRWRNQEAFEEFEAGLIREHLYFRECYLPETPAEVLKSLPSPQKIKKRLLRQFQINEPCYKLFLCIKEMGIATGIASNYSSWYAEILKKIPPLESNSDYLFFSCEMGLRKPDPGFYSLIQGSLAERGYGKIFFCDDRPANLEAASEKGWSVALCQDILELKSRLENFLEVPLPL